MEIPTEILFEQKQLYDKNLYNIRLILSNLYKEIQPKDCTMTFDDTRYRLFDTVYAIEGTFPFRFIIFMDTYLISHIYLVFFTESDIQTDYADLLAIYPQIHELVNKTLIQSVRILNPLMNDIYSVYDAYLIDDFDKQKYLNTIKGQVSLYYVSLDSVFNKMPKQCPTIDDWFIKYFKDIYTKTFPKPPVQPINPDPTQIFSQLGIDPRQLINNLKPEDKTKLMRGESIEFDFGFGKGFLQGIPIPIDDKPPNSASIRAAFIMELNTKLQEIYDNTITPLPITPKYINLIYSNLEKEGFFSSESVKDILTVFDTPEGFKRFVNNIIRKFYKSKTG